MKLESTVAVAAMSATTETPKRKRSGYLLEAFVEVQTNCNMIVAAANPRAEIERLRDRLSHRGRIPLFYFYVAHSEMVRRELLQGGGTPPATRH